MTTTTLLSVNGFSTRALIEDTNEIKSNQIKYWFLWRGEEETYCHISKGTAVICRWVSKQGNLVSSNQTDNKALKIANHMTES